MLSDVDIQEQVSTVLVHIMSVLQMCMCLSVQSLAAGWLFHYSYRCQPVDYSNSPRAI